MEELKELLEKAHTMASDLGYGDIEENLLNALVVIDQQEQLANQHLEELP